MDEYTGQCVGGPDEGNFVTSRVERYRFRAIYKSGLDGEACQWSVTETRGWYNWDADEKVFVWELQRSESRFE